MSITTSNQAERSRARNDLRRRSRRGGGGVDRRRHRQRPERDDRGSGDGGTLEELIAAAADQLTVFGAARCPVCREPELAPAGCGACGAQLS